MNWVISDIHGCYDEFINLKNKIEMKDIKAVIIIAGDILDRGPKVAEILEWCMENCNRNEGRYTLLMGNHEDMAIDWYDDSSVYWYKNKRKKEKVIEFLKKLPLFYVVNTPKKKFLIAHAWAPDQNRMKEILSGDEITDRDRNFFLWERRDGEAYDSDELYLIHGHTPTINAYSKEKAKIYIYKNVINIDCGCVWHQVGGRLAALCLEKEEVIYQ